MSQPFRLKDIRPGSVGASPYLRQSIVLAGRLFFEADDGSTGAELWSTDGTAAGTRLVKDIYGGVEPSYPFRLTGLGNRVVFSAEAANGREPWVSDGTSAGTSLLKDIAPGFYSQTFPKGSYPSKFVAFGSRLFFFAEAENRDHQLWATDGTPAGTQLVRTLGDQDTSYPHDLNVVGNQLLFWADDGVHGQELWRVDGSLQASLLKDINPGVADGNPDSGSFNYVMKTALGERLFFSATDGVNGAELWSSDGTAAGTRLLKDMNPGSSGTYLDDPTVLANQLFFMATKPFAFAQELWGSDGTPAGTRLVKRFDQAGAGSLRSFPTISAVLGSKLFLDVFTADEGHQLWISNGTTAGTQLLKVINPGKGVSSGSGYFGFSLKTVVGDKLFFTANDGQSGQELWVSDGTAAGTRLVKDIRPGAAGSVAGRGPFTAAGNQLFFWADDGQHGRELWRSDGTAAGTTLVADLNPGPEGSDLVTGPGSPSFDYTTKVLGDKLIFSANDGTTGAELWALQLGAAPPPPPAPVVAVAPLSANKAEGISGSTPFTFLVSRAGNLSDGSTVRWAVSAPADRPSPASPVDFTGGVFPTGTVTFAAGESSRTVTVNVNGDTDVEADAPFRFSLSAPTAAVLNPSASAAIGTILNDDSRLAITPLSASKAEGNSGATPFTFRVTRIGNTAGVSTAQWAVAPVGSSGVDGADFAGGAFPMGTVSFAAGQATRTVTVSVAGDRAVESNESFQVSLSEPSIGTILGTASATGTILNDDTALAIAPLASSKGEGRTGTTPYTFKISRSGNLSGSSTVRWDAAGFRLDFGDFDPATAADFSGPTSGSLTFAPNQAIHTLTVAVRGDIQQERDDVFSVNLSAPTGASLALPQALGTIRNDDLIGDATANSLVGSELAEYLDGGANGDTLTGAGAADVFGFRFSQSPLTAPDRITDFAFGADKIDVFAASGGALPAPVAFSRAADNSTAASLESLAAAVFADANGARSGNQALAANSAVLVQATNAAIAGTYLLINNGVAARSGSDDLMINMSGFTGALPALGLIAPGLVFV